ncbi:MAG: trypsin-like peptidase domain-containing protein [Clostridia bacterium]|nr:trypsin-like peptidase domain-containing protein [Clostridia bacterium]
MADTAELTEENTESTDVASADGASEDTRGTETSEEASVNALKQTEEKTEPIVRYRWDYQEQKHYDERHSRRPRRSGKLVYASVFTLVFLLTVSLLVGALLLGEFFGTSSSPTYGSIGDLYEECLPSYVAISVTTATGEGVGSGVIITSDGYIATNYPVVEDSVAISVIMSDGTTYDAEFIDGDELNDIAVVKIKAQNLPAAKLGTSKNSRVGDQVMAIGTPHSVNYQGTMTSGYISALDRRFVEQNANGTVKKVLYLIQTDTSVNPGNSGGPLFNMSGEVIGIVTLKIAGENYEGLGFALPMESVIDMINDIIQNGEITDPDAGGANQGAALGISGFAVTEDTKYLLSGQYHYRVIMDEEKKEEIVIIPTIYGEIEVPLSDKETLDSYEITDYTFYTAPATGIYVADTTDGFDSAEKLKKDDVLVTADGISCKQMAALQSLIADKRIGDQIEFEVFRDGKLIMVTVELGEAASFE